MLIEIFADFICPWCFIGKRRLERALAERPDVQAEVRWLPFQLNPDMPTAGMDRTAYLAAKFGGLDRARHVYAGIQAAAVRDGLSLALGRIGRTPSTFDAHRLMRLAERQGVDGPLAEALFRAYFEDGRNIGDHEVLAAVAGTCGLGREETMRHLASPADAAGVRASDAQARQLGVQAVPCFIFNRRYAVSGAQDPASFLPLFDLAEDETRMTA